MDTPQEFAKRKGFTAEPPETTSYYIMFMMMRMYAKYYHEHQVKNCDLADVGGNEVALCRCSEDETTGWIKLKCCNICGKPQEQ